MGLLPYIRVNLRENYDCIYPGYCYLNNGLLSKMCGPDTQRVTTDYTDLHGQSMMFGSCTYGLFWYKICLRRKKTAFVKQSVLSVPRREASGHLPLCGDVIIPDIMPSAPPLRIRLRRKIRLWRKKRLGITHRFCGRPNNIMNSNLDDKHLIRPSPRRWGRI